jgi:acetyl esterase/lipase
MTSKLPTTREEILATGTIDPAVASVISANPFPPGSDYTIEILKDITAAMYPRLRASMSASRPSDVEEAEHYIPMPDGYKSRVLVCSPSPPLTAQNSPLIVLFYGGGHCVGNPESELPLARKLVQAFSAVVVLPSYRLAPEHTFPSSINDAWSTLQSLATLLQTKPESSIIPASANPASGFLIGGTSSGANLTATLSHLARDNALSPPLTGQFLSCGSFMSPHHVPAKYKPLYLSRAQNRSAPLLDEALLAIFQAAFKPDHTSPLWASFDQHDPRDVAGEEVAHGHMQLPRAFFQVCGADMSRDDSLIYERLLREECGIATRLDLYAGFPHVWWGMPQFAGLEMTGRRMADTVEGFRWLLAKGGDVGK